MTERDDDFLKRWSRRKQAAASDAKRAKEEELNSSLSWRSWRPWRFN